MTFCYCGLPLKDNKCPRHKEKITKEVRQKIGDYSGYSKNKEYGINWRKYGHTPNPGT